MLKKIGQAASLLVLLALASSIVLMRFGGVGVYAVMSGSMVPAIPVGSLVVVTSADSSAVNVGDVITFQLPDRVVTHRVIAIDHDTTGLIFTTKGDANEVADQSQIRLHASVGIVRATMPGAGYFVVYAQMYWRLIAMGGAGIVFVIAAGMLLTSKPRPLAAPRPRPAAATPAPREAREVRPASASTHDELWAAHLNWLGARDRAAA